MSVDRTRETSDDADAGTLLQKRVDRRRALGVLLGGIAAATQAVSACAPVKPMTDEQRETFHNETDAIKLKSFDRHR